MNGPKDSNRYSASFLMHYLPENGEFPEHLVLHFIAAPQEQRKSDTLLNAWAVHQSLMSALCLDKQHRVCFNGFCCLAAFWLFVSFSARKPWGGGYEQKHCSELEDYIMATCKYSGPSRPLLH